MTTDETAALRRELTGLRALVQVHEASIAALAGRVAALEQGKAPPARVPGFPRLEPVVSWPSSSSSTRLSRQLGSYCPDPRQQDGESIADYCERTQPEDGDQ